MNKSKSKKNLHYQKKKITKLKEKSDLAKEVDQIDKEIQMYEDQTNKTLNYLHTIGAIDSSVDISEDVSYREMVKAKIKNNFRTLVSLKNLPSLSAFSAIPKSR